MTHENIQEIPLAKIKSDNIRDHMNQETLKGLAASIKAVGQLSPIRVRSAGELYAIIDGHRRTAARKLLGEANVLAIVERDPISDAAAVQRALIANAQREGLTPLAMAKATARLMEETGWNASQTAAQLGFPVSKVTKLLSFLRLPEGLADRLSSKGAGASVAYQLARIEDPSRQARVAEQFLNGEVTRDAIGSQVKRSNPAPPRSKTKRTNRISIALDVGRSVTVLGGDLTLETVISQLQEVLAKARQARAKGWELTTLVRTLKDQAKERQR